LQDAKKMDIVNEEKGKIEVKGEEKNQDKV